MRMALLVSEEKFFRNFDKNFLKANLRSRFCLTDTDRIVGARKGGFFCIYRKKKALFSLFSTTLYGRVLQDKKTIRCFFSRPIFVLIPYLLWCLALLGTGVLIFPEDVIFSLYFLFPGILLSVPLFFFSAREKKTLTEALEKAALPQQERQKDA